LAKSPHNYLVQADFIQWKASNAIACDEGKPPVPHPYAPYYKAVNSRSEEFSIDKALSHASNKTVSAEVDTLKTTQNYLSQSERIKLKASKAKACDERKLPVRNPYGTYYNVLYDRNNSKATGCQFDPLSYASGETATVLESGDVKFGSNRFLSWNTNIDGGGDTYLPGAKLKLYRNVTLYARWAKSRVFYNKNYPSATGQQVDSTERFDGEVAPILGLGTIAFPFEIGEFYWNTKADDTGTRYYEGGTIVTNGNVTLYLIAKVFIRYLKNSADATEAPIDENLYTIGTPANVSAEGKMSLVQHRFMGWLDEEAGTTYQPGTQINLYKTLYLKAQWQEVFRVFYDANSFLATGDQFDPIERFAGETVTLLDKGTLAYTKHRFMGWLDEEAGTTYQPGTLITVARSLYLKAIWQDTFRVFYDKGSVNATGEQTDLTERIAGETAIVLDKGTITVVPLDYGYYYWTTQPNGAGTSYTVGSALQVTGDITLYIFTDSVIVNPTPNMNYGKRNENATGFQADNNIYEPNDDIVILDQGTMTDPNATFLYWSNNYIIDQGTFFSPGQTVKFSQIDVNNYGYGWLYAVWSVETFDY
jgi:hypothetical protein